MSTSDLRFNSFLVFPCVGWFVGLEDGFRAVGNVLTDANFPKPEHLYCRCLTRKRMKDKGDMNRERPRKYRTITTTKFVVCSFHWRRPLGMLSLPLLWEIVTADASLSGNGGARCSIRGGRWEIKNARCRQIRTRAVGSMVR